MTGYKVFNTAELADVLDKVPDAKIIAGGTDVMVLANGKDDFFSNIVEISSVKELDFIRLNGKTVEIGAGTLHSTIAKDEIIKKYAPCLSMASAIIGSPQIRNMGTIGGNICNASPAGDTLAPLYALGANITLISKKGKRILPISSFIKGVRKTDIQPGEFVSKISFDINENNNVSVYKRSATRKSLAITKAGVAVVCHRDNDGVFSNVKIYFSSVGITTMEAKYCMELFEKNKNITKEDIRSAVMKDCSPIDDIRSTKEYRWHILGVMLKDIADLA